jgi:Fe-S cluster biosynthesis and repair protein YggX
MPENAIKKQQTLPTADAVLQDSVRVRPSQLAKLFCVSKQAVSAWILKGTISTYPDGSINPKVAAREYINHTDPNRVKVSIFKFLTDDVGTLKNQIQKLNAKISELETELTTTKSEREEWVVESQNATKDGFEFLKKIINETELKNAVIANDYDFLELKLDDYFFRDREENEEETTDQ